MDSSEKPSLDIKKLLDVLKRVISVADSLGRVFLQPCGIKSFPLGKEYLNESVVLNLLHIA